MDVSFPHGYRIILCFFFWFVPGLPKNTVPVSKSEKCLLFARYSIPGN